MKFCVLFAVVTKPLLEIMFHIFLCLGRLGLTFQASILADLLALVSFHVYCIYVYAARFVSFASSADKSEILVVCSG